MKKSVLPIFKTEFDRKQAVLRTELAICNAMSKLYEFLINEKFDHKTATSISKNEYFDEFKKPQDFDFTPKQLEFVETQLHVIRANQLYVSTIQWHGAVKAVAQSN